MNDVEQTVFWLPQAAVMHLVLQKQVICLGNRRSFVSHKGPSAYFTYVKTKQICSSEVSKERFRLERICEVTQSIQGRADGRAFDLLRHSREHSLQGWCISVAGDWSQAAREM